MTVTHQKRKELVFGKDSQETIRVIKKTDDCCFCGLKKECFLSNEIDNTFGDWAICNDCIIQLYPHAALKKLKD